MKMLVAYDIADPIRLARVAKIMEDYGTRVQKSIFEVSARKGIFLEMKERIERVMEPAEDGVKYFPLCEKCAQRVELIGKGCYIDPDAEYYIY
ncbi:MAG: CRISPR-associated endonuclease Cas2 [Syntrophales bacterium]|jgi:CRISPR-associated protein Cas2|nr:CRISPR-associated endonuclease Cas2 [Syntrophales bacterium]